MRHTSTTTVCAGDLNGVRLRHDGAARSSSVNSSWERRISGSWRAGLGSKAIAVLMPFMPCLQLCSIHAAFIQQRAVTARRKPAKRADPIRAPGWLAILLLVALICVIGAVLL